MENLDIGRGHGQNVDHLTMVILKFRPWSWSKIFDHMTMTPGCRPNGQKIMVALPPPNLSLILILFSGWRQGQKFVAVWTAKNRGAATGQNVKNGGIVAAAIVKVATKLVKIATLSQQIFKKLRHKLRI